MGSLGRRISYWLQRRRHEAELREEIEAHRQLREDAFRDRGHATPEAASRRAIGNVTLAVEDTRGVWIWPWLESVLIDLRHGLKSLVRHPTHTLTALATLAIGTGALAASFALAHTVLLKATPYPNDDRLVQFVRVREGKTGLEMASVDIEALSRARSFEGVTLSYNTSVSLTGDGLPENARGIYTDPQLFPVLGTLPIAGRWPSAADATSATPPVVLSHRLWQRRYQGRTDVIGQLVHINGRAHMIAAVMPPEFGYPAPYYVTGDLWLFRDASHPSMKEPDRPLLLGFGLLAPHASREQAQAEVEAIASGMRAGFPDSHAGVSFRVLDWAGTIRRGARQTLLLLVAAAGVVFLIVCINLFNLLLCRGIDRASEMTTRASLGAGRVRLVRHIVTETVVLFAAGGLAGLLVALWLSRGIAAIASFDIPRMNEIALGWPVAIATFGLVCAAGVIVGILPALRATAPRRLGRNRLTRSMTHDRRGRLVQRGLIASEIGLAAVLVCGAGAIATHAARLEAVDAGFDSTGLVQARITLPANRYPEIAQQSAVLTDVLTRLRAHPAIESAGVVDLPPGLSGSVTRAVTLDADPEPRRAQDLRLAAVRVVSEGYLETLGLRPVAGRFPGTADRSGPIAVVNEEFARQYLAGRSALGSTVRVTLDGPAQLDPEGRTIVGIVPDIREDVLYRPVPPAIYIPMTQAESRRMAFVFRTNHEGDFSSFVRQAIAEAAPGIAVSGLVMPLGDLMRTEFARTRLSLRLVGGLASIALLLAVIGVYGVTAHGVRHRTREIGIRLALGLAPRGVRHLVIREGLVLLTAGLLGGALLAAWLMPLVSTLVVGLNELEVPVAAPLSVAAVILAAAVLAGCAIPARRAARVDPTQALR